VDAIRFFQLLKDSNEPWWDEYINKNKLSFIARVFTIKSVYELSKASYDSIIEWAQSILLEGNRLKEDFYTVKFMMKPLGLR
jgi:hypothetical protein